MKRGTSPDFLLVGCIVLPVFAFFIAGPEAGAGAFCGLFAARMHHRRAAGAGSRRL